MGEKKVKLHQVETAHQGLIAGGNLRKLLPYRLHANLCRMEHQWPPQFAAPDQDKA